MRKCRRETFSTDSKSWSNLLPSMPPPRNISFDENLQPGSLYALNSATSLCELIKFKYLNWKNIFMPIEFSLPESFQNGAESQQWSGRENFLFIKFVLCWTCRMEREVRIIPPSNNFICYPRWYISRSRLPLSPRALESIFNIRHTFTFAEMCNMEWYSVERISISQEVGSPLLERRHR